MRHPAPLVVLAHGGAGSRPMTGPQRAILERALVLGHECLQQGGASLDAVEAAVRVLEASGLFNAGLGARVQLDGTRRMDAALMEGRELRAGAVAGIEEVRHPIAAARLVMERTTHVLLAGPPATQFARYFKLERQPSVPRPRRGLTVRDARTASEKQMLALFGGMRRGRVRGGETVGAVALDSTGTVGAATSTGGIHLMLPGRVGDSPLIGCGVYADNESGAVSMTGLGESIIRAAVAKDIVARLAAGIRPSVAAAQALRRLVNRIQGSAGAIVLTPDGHFGIRHTTPHMCAGYVTGRGRPTIKDVFR